MKRLALIALVLPIAGCATSAPVHLGGYEYEMTSWSGKAALYPELEAFCASKGARFKEVFASTTTPTTYTFYCLPPGGYMGPAQQRLQLEIR